MTEEKIIQEFVKYICSNCTSKHCNKGITITQGKECNARCVDYEKGQVKGYVRPIIRLAKQRKSLMGFTQEYL